MFVWRASAEAFHVDCLVFTMKHGGCCVIVWGAISWRDLGTLVVFREKVRSEYYRSILTDYLHPMHRALFPREHLLFQDSVHAHTASCVQTWLDEPMMKWNIPRSVPSPLILTSFSLCGFLENKVRARFPPARTLPELATVLQKEGCESS